MSDDAPNPALPAGPPPGRTIALLSHGPFARYAIGETISMTGTWMQSMALSWVMLDMTTKAVMLSNINAAASVPMLALSMYGGTMADKYDKRKILVVTNLAQVVLAAAIGGLILLGHVHIWHLLIASALLGVVNAFEMPSASAFVPELVTREQIAGAIAIDRSIFHGTRLLGPAIAGVLIGIWGTAPAFFANALSFFAMIAAILSIGPRARGTAEEERQRSEGGMKAGIDYVRKDRPTLAMLGLMAANSLCIFPFMAVMMPLYSRDVLGLNSRYTGLLMAASGIGSLVASVGLLSVPRAWRVTAMAAASVMIMLALAALGESHAFWQAVTALPLLAVGTSLNFGLANTTVQERAPNAIRGRVSAIAMMSFIGIMPFAAELVGYLVDSIGMRTSMVIGAVTYGITSLLVLAGPARRSGHLPLPESAPLAMEA